MKNQDEILRNYQKYLIEQHKEQLEKNETLISAFIKYASTKNIYLSKDNFDYIQSIGIIATYPNLVYLLNSNIQEDKEGLVDTAILEKEYKTEKFAKGYYYSEKYMAMAHPYFRRSHSEYANFAPRFIEIYEDYRVSQNEKYIAIDSDRVRINVNNMMTLEFDTWFGAKFKNNISDIEDGIVKLRPPIDLNSFEIDFIFGGTYSLDIKWETKNNIKSFQAEEFKTEENTIVINDETYYPVKYIHSEYDIEAKNFRHFDGAIHLYTKDEYFLRRDEDYNYNRKSQVHLKSLSKKLFKINGNITVKDWVELVSHFLTGNPLIFEYFEGKLPENVLETVESIRKNKSNNHSA